MGLYFYVKCGVEVCGLYKVREVVNKKVASIICD